MSVYLKLAQLLPVERSTGERIAQLRQLLIEKEGDEKAHAHIVLHEIYRAEAQRRPLLSKPFQDLAQDHLEGAVEWARVWPAPWGLLGVSQIATGDLWNGIENLSRFYEMQRVWISVVGADIRDTERRDLCRRLALGALARSQLGQFSAARVWFGEVLEELTALATQPTTDDTALRDAVVLGVSGNLLLEFKYPEALQFIDRMLSEAAGWTLQPATRGSLMASKTILQRVDALTHDFQPQPHAEELWASLMEEVQRCPTPEAAREARAKILSAIKTHDVNREIQRLGLGVVHAFEQQSQAIQDWTPLAPTIRPSTLPEVGLPHGGNSHFQEAAAKMAAASAALIEQQRQIAQKLDDLIRTLHQATQSLQRRNITAVRRIAASVYSIPWYLRVRWVGLSATRYVIQILAVAYFLDKVVDRLLDKAGDSLAEIVDIPFTQALIPLGVLLLGVALGQWAEKRIDSWALPRYKRLLTRIVFDRSSRLWTSYNILLKLLTDASEATRKYEEQLQALGITRPIR